MRWGGGGEGGAGAQPGYNQEGERGDGQLLAMDTADVAIIIVAAHAGLDHWRFNCGALVYQTHYT